jgi:hypothetical protein
MIPNGSNLAENGLKIEWPDSIFKTDRPIFRSLFLLVFVAHILWGNLGCPGSAPIEANDENPKRLGQESSLGKPQPSDGPRFSPLAPETPVQDLARFIPQRDGFCVQIRSVDNEKEALALKNNIQEQLSVPVHILTADLKKKGTWHRICVGNAATEEEATILANGWSKPNGPLIPFMEKAQKGEATFFVKPIGQLAPVFMPQKTQNDRLLQVSPSMERPVFFARAAHVDQWIGVAHSKPDASGRCQLVTTDSEGKSLELVGSKGPGCAACENVLNKQKVLCRQVIGAGDVGPWPGDELLILEKTEHNESILVVLAQGMKNTLERRAAFWHSSFSDDLYLTTDASIEKLSAGAPGVLSLFRSEASLVDGHVCSMKQYGEFWLIFDHERFALQDKKNWVLHEHDAMIPKIVEYLDSRKLFRQASQICADAVRLVETDDVSSFCLERVRTLVAIGYQRAAINGLALLSLASKPLALSHTRLLADLIVSAGQRMRFDVDQSNCIKNPLVKRSEAKHVEQSIGLAASRLDLGAKSEAFGPDQISDALFVSGFTYLEQHPEALAVIKKWYTHLGQMAPARTSQVEARLTSANPGRKIGP